ncbi:MAG: hypothetical protein Q8R00_01090 [Candidatus Nanoarchaeia archaeon]|nr:hypothetical protein [Candidatus Nanoarchaeia archaeon]
MTNQVLESRVLEYGLKPREMANLSPENLLLLERLERFEAPYLKEKLLNDKKFEDESNYNDAFTEFKKYVALTKIWEGPLSMVSKEVDEVWHQFILFTAAYHKFCQENLGEYLHHQPKTSITPLDPSGKSNFFKAYEVIFGSLPKIWKAKENQSDDCTPSGWGPANCDNEQDD